MNARAAPFDCVDHVLMIATQAGLPLVPDPWGEIAAHIGSTPEDVRIRLRALLDSGVIRRIGAVPNHYAIGYAANGMSVWDVDDARVDELGARVGALPFVTHCYRRPRDLPAWPYNLFAMLHGDSRVVVEAQAAQVAVLLGEAYRARDILYSTKILKKAGLRI